MRASQFRLDLRSYHRVAFSRESPLSRALPLPPRMMLLLVTILLRLSTRSTVLLDPFPKLSSLRTRPPHPPVLRPFVHALTQQLLRPSRAVASPCSASISISPPARTTTAPMCKKITIASKQKLCLEQHGQVRASPPIPLHHTPPPLQVNAFQY